MGVTRRSGKNSIDDRDVPGFVGSQVLAQNLIQDRMRFVCDDSSRPADCLGQRKCVGSDLRKGLENNVARSNQVAEQIKLWLQIFAVELDRWSGRFVARKELKQSHSCFSNR